MEKQSAWWSVHLCHSYWKQKTELAAQHTAAIIARAVVDRSQVLFSIKVSFEDLQISKLLTFSVGWVCARVVTVKEAVHSVEFSPQVSDPYSGSSIKNHAIFHPILFFGKHQHGARFFCAITHQIQPAKKIPIINELIFFHAKYYMSRWSLRDSNRLFLYVLKGPNIGFIFAHHVTAFKIYPKEVPRVCNEIIRLSLCSICSSRLWIFLIWNKSLIKGHYLLYQALVT